jgi:hypothetical protein
MARIRTLKPEILEDEMTAGLSDAAFRLFVAMIVLADDHGNIRAETRWLEGQVWWSRRFAEVRGEIPRVAAMGARAQEALTELSAASLIELYEVRSQLYAHIRSWEKHQRIDNAGKPRVPLPSEGALVSPNFAEVRGEIPRNSAGPPTTTTTTTRTTEVEKPKPEPKSKTKPESSPEALQAAERLLGLVVVNNPSSTLAKAPEDRRRATAVRWADTMRLLHEVDRHSWEEIASLVDWCQADQFWRSNILSADKLREKWDQLTAKKNASQGGVRTASDALEAQLARVRMLREEEARAEEERS